MAATPTPVDPPTTTPKAEAEAAEAEAATTTPSATPQIHTYHCICNQLVLATTHTLSTLPHRRGPSLDKAVILPVPPPPRSSSSTTSSPSASSSSSDETEASKPGRAPGRRRNKAAPQTHYSLLISTTQDRRPVIVRREDGFEKRWLYRCGRCRVVVAYALDEVHFVGTEEGEKRGAGRTRGRERERVVYVLPGGLRSTGDMLASKGLREDEVDLRGSGDG